jgi:hypothetical protein
MLQTGCLTTVCHLQCSYGETFTMQPGVMVDTTGRKCRRLWVLTFQGNIEEENKTVNRNTWVSDRNTNRVPHQCKIRTLPLRKPA